MTVKETAEYDNFLGKKEEVAKPEALFEIEEDDESEQYYADVTEYLRIIVMTFYLEVLRTKLPQDKDR